MEKISSEKIIGYLLLTIGILIILYSGFNVYQVFTNKARPINLFAFQGVSLDFGKLVEEVPQEADLKQELVAPDVLNQPLNYVAQLLFMGFMATVGYKIASIGAMLVRPIKVKLKEDTKSTPK